MILILRCCSSIQIPCMEMGTRALLAPSLRDRNGQCHIPKAIKLVMLSAGSNKERFGKLIPLWTKLGVKATELGTFIQAAVLPLTTGAVHLKEHLLKARPCQQPGLSSRMQTATVPTGDPTGAGMCPHGARARDGTVSLLRRLHRACPGQSQGVHLHGKTRPSTDPQALICSGL